MPAALKKLLSAEVNERVEMEFEVLDRMGYNGYFLIVQDFINWGKDQGSSLVLDVVRQREASLPMRYALRILTH